jgi:V/A-type H+-transporting ATPase subunit E
MDVKLENLIEKIKKDGIDEAQKESQTIIDKAKEQAAAIIKEAQSKAQKLIEDGKKDVEKLKSNGEKSLQQAARDLALSLREQLTGLFDRLLKQKISGELSPEFLKDMIAKIIDNWSKDKKAEIEVLVSEKDKKKLEELLMAELKEEAKKTIDIKISKTIEKGFHIGIKGQDVYYDFTDESILEALREFLNPSLAAILNTNNG